MSTKGQAFRWVLVHRKRTIWQAEIAAADIKTQRQKLKLGYKVVASAMLVGIALGFIMAICLQQSSTISVEGAPSTTGPSATASSTSIDARTELGGRLWKSSVFHFAGSRLWVLASTERHGCPGELGTWADTITRGNFARGRGGP